MANGYFARGEIYWVRMDNGFGGEQGVGRPGLIVSSDRENTKQSTVTIVFMSTKFHATQNYVPVDATGQTSYVICNQIMTYDKTRLGKCLGMLNAEEQKAVDDALERVFDLGYADEKALKEKDNEIADRNVLIGDLKAEMAVVKAEVANKDEEIASLKMEIEMWQKCYGRCMDMLVDVKVSGDVARRTAVAAPVKVVEVAPENPAEPPKQPEPPKNPEPEKDNRLDVNSCTATALKKIGFSLGMARKIVAARPFKSVEDLKRINGLKVTQYRVMEPKLCCKPTIKSALVEKDPGHEPESVVEEPVVNEEPVVEVAPVVEAAPVVKVNVNTASAKEISATLGVCMATGYSIVGWRKKNRPFEKLEDLLGVANIGPGSLQRWGHLVEI